MRAQGVSTVRCVVLLLLLAGSNIASAQTQTSFTYQGRLTSGGGAASGLHDFQFKLFDEANNQVGVTIPRDDVTVTGGVFTVILDFGSVFDGSPRQLEIAVRPGAASGDDPYTTLVPRQPITSTPYSIRSSQSDTADVATNSTQLGGIDSSQYVQTKDARLSDARVPLPGSADYIQNSISPQAASNFNIIGNGLIGGTLSANTAAVGTLNPTPGISLEVNGAVLLTPGGSGGQVSFGTPNAETGMTIKGVNTRADVRFNGNTLKLVAASGVGPPPSTSGVAISTTGQVGIGTDTPNRGALHVTASGTAIFGSGGTGVTAESDNGTALVTQSRTGNQVDGYVPIPGIPGCCRVYHITNVGTYVAGSDFAEALPARGSKDLYEPGDVLVFRGRALRGAAGAVEKSTRVYDTRLIGVYSTRPGVLGAEKGGVTRVDPGEVPVAIIGIVPTKVSTENGPVQIGDLLTTSKTPGYAMRCSNRLKCVGAILGKAMEPLSKGKGMIKVLVTLR